MKTTSPVSRGVVHIGTSGWHCGHWRGPFYPEDLPGARMLRWYTQQFDTVEINNSCYRLPTTEALAGWCRETPREFCFSAKASATLRITSSSKTRDKAARSFSRR